MTEYRYLKAETNYWLTRQHGGGAKCNRLLYAMPMCNKFVAMQVQHVTGWMLQTNGGCVSANKKFCIDR